MAGTEGWAMAAFPALEELGQRRERWARYLGAAGRRAEDRDLEHTTCNGYARSRFNIRGYVLVGQGFGLSKYKHLSIAGFIDR